MPGESWFETIHKALRDSVGLLLFLSPESVNSPTMLRELTVASDDPARFIIPVMLRRVEDLPPSLEYLLLPLHWIDMGDAGADIDTAVMRIADVTEQKLKKKRGAAARPPVTPAQAPELAADIAREVRGATQPDAGEAAAAGKPPDSVFVVHGHHEAALSEVETYLGDLGVRPIILSKLGGAEQSLLRKFFKVASDARFAIVIVSADDLGASRVQYEAEGVGAHALQFRARQNVILELGFFYGRLGWENVFVLYKRPEKVFPNFERPSDIEGAVFDSMDETGAWRDSLNRKLAEAGFRIEKMAAQKK